MNLQNLVPPWELCKLIPKWEFEDSAFVWATKKAEPPYVGRTIGINGGTEVDGDYTLCTREHAKKVLWDCCGGSIPCPKFPAPTLQEIMEKIDKMTCSITTVSKLPSSWKIDTIDKEDNLFVRRSEKSPVSAALRLWLELMGVGSEGKNE